MILVDTSAWVEFLRGTDHPAADRVAQAVSSEMATCDAIRMEVLAGGRDEAHLVELRGLLARATQLPTTSRHYDDAARLFRHARSRGLTVRRLIDCLIAAVAIDADVPILHADRDFDALAECCPLRIVT